jgi:hypothetical protein
LLEDPLRFGRRIHSDLPCLCDVVFHASDKRRR